MPILKNYRQLRNLGVFVDHTHSAELPDFAQFNLIYGFNGSGKTTLSRVLRSIELGIVSPHLPEGGEFGVEFSDGQTKKHDGLNNTPNKSIVVFNEDFVEENLRWTDGTASPLFFIGKEQADLSKLLETVSAHLEKRTQDHNKSVQAEEQVNTLFRTFKTNTARLIAEELNLGRKYTATNLDADYASLDVSAFKLLTQHERLARKHLINQLNPMAKLEVVDINISELARYIETVISLCNTSFSSAAITALKQHATMLQWAKEGLDYHREHSLTDCLFCGNAITEERFDDLEKSFDEGFAQLGVAIAAARTEGVGFISRIATLRERLPVRSAFDPDLADDAEASRDALIASLEAIAAQCSAAASLLGEKARMPNVTLGTSGLSLSQAQADDAACQSQGNGLNKLIKTHNEKIERFEEEKESALLELKAHFLLEGAKQYQELGAQLTAASASEAMRDNLLKKMTQCEAEIQSRLLSHGLAVEPINKLLHPYLGHGELTIATLNAGYQIQRKSTAIKGPLSEGEKTALALCYFLSKLEENGRQKKDVIAVVDDPISSLDSKALNYAMALLRISLTGAAQVFVITHNLQFMNEAKKWLKPLARKTPPLASLYFLDLRYDGVTRNTKLKPLPKLLRDYDSEYHYLFSLALAFYVSEDDHAHMGYVLPNVLRKLLELFLSFKLPGPDGLGSKIQNGYVCDCGIGQARINALLRLADVESHGDSLDDLLNFSSMNIEEVRDAVQALFALMETLDLPHVRRMKELCG
jgi:wobble nucleotide-excising tRNase